ncbi:hypothetical protein [Streptomyces sp. Tu102]|uniref:hypothetical protein n=1 Tax=Streptomyces sp. Tu102 TaxID=2838019 RepID=UPI001BDC4579|nr:hypothetical protein [Streptomyces sp. Tu102]MBT1095089.1 hypothetical protein [Streptomyces sp. Tu102]
MKIGTDLLSLITVVIIISVVIASLAAAVMGLLSCLDGASVPRALLRAGAAFGGSLTVVASLLTVLASAIK